MEAPSRSSQKYLLLQVWCGILTVSLVAMAVFVASIRSKPEEVSFPDPNKLLLHTCMVTLASLNPSDYLDDPGWQEHVVCASCSLSLHQNSIYISNSSARSRFFIYAQVVFRRQKKHGLSVKLIRNPSPGKKEKTEAEVPAAEAGGLVWMGRIVSLNGGDSVRLNITGEYERDKTFWGAFQLL
uniref:TNF family profile domain-containing protein n=1 Tax=Cyprinodon variegatus TaxID=28743 RepID=A0A3Q2GPK3_CYPVA